MTVCRMTRFKVKVTSALDPLKGNRPSVPHGTKFFSLATVHFSLTGILLLAIEDFVVPKVLLDHYCQSCCQMAN